MVVNPLFSFSCVPSTERLNVFNKFVCVQQILLPLSNWPSFNKNSDLTARTISMPFPSIGTLISPFSFHFHIFISLAANLPSIGFRCSFISQIPHNESFSQKKSVSCCHKTCYIQCIQGRHQIAGMAPRRIGCN